MLVLRQSTAVDVLIGPFVDSTDGYTAETGVSPSVRLSKNGQALASKSDVTTPAHDSNGYYNCELDATDTNTVGTLVLIVAGSSTSLPVRHEYQVIEEDAYDAIYASGAHPVETGDLPSNFGSLSITGTGRVDVASIEGSDATDQINAACDTALADYDAPTKAELDSGLAGLNDLSTSDIDARLTAYDAPTKAEMDAGFAALNDLSAADVNAEVDTALADYDGPTNAEMTAAFTEIKGATWSATDTLEQIRDNAGGLDAAGVRSAVGLASANLDTQLGAIPTTAPLDAAGTRAALGFASADFDTQIAALPTAAENAAAVFDTAMTEGYAADGNTMTLAQGLYMLRAVLMDASVASTTLTAYRLDGTTAAMTFTLNDDTEPTSISRTT